MKQRKKEIIDIFFNLLENFFILQKFTFILIKYIKSTIFVEKMSN